MYSLCRPPVRPMRWRNLVAVFFSYFSFIYLDGHKKIPSQRWELGLGVICISLFSFFIVTPSPAGQHAIASFFSYFLFHFTGDSVRRILPAGSRQDFFSFYLYCDPACKNSHGSYLLRSLGSHFLRLFLPIHQVGKWEPGTDERSVYIFISDFFSWTDRS